MTPASCNARSAANRSQHEAYLRTGAGWVVLPQGKDGVSSSKVARSWGINGSATEGFGGSVYCGLV